MAAHTARLPSARLEFDIRSGCALFDRRRRLRRVSVREEGGLIVAER
jgi:hypothetical protein